MDQEAPKTPVMLAFQDLQHLQRRYGRENLQVALLLLLWEPLDGSSPVEALLRHLRTGHVHDSLRPLHTIRDLALSVARIAASDTQVGSSDLSRFVHIEDEAQRIVVAADEGIETLYRVSAAVHQLHDMGQPSERHSGDA